MLVHERTEANTRPISPQCPYQRDPHARQVSIFLCRF
uniref:Uncharacterized protein n=1 Tax=Rhizophora mucronata TaxID=61149 RepID=A0A2P2P2C1_RHIMU